MIRTETQIENVVISQFLITLCIYAVIFHDKQLLLLYYIG